MGATYVENWDIACVIVQNVRIPVGPDLDLPLLEKQQILDQVKVAPVNKNVKTKCYKGERVVIYIPDSETLILCYFCTCHVRCTNTDEMGCVDH